MNGAKLGEFIIRYRWWVIVFSLFLMAGAASGARFLGFDTNYRVFFSDDNPELLAFEALQDTYTKNDNVLMVVAPDDGEVFTRETLAAVEELTKASWQIPYSLRVDSITNFQHTWADGDELIVEDLVENASGLSDSEILAIKNVALSEPLLANRLISSKGHVTGVNVTINLPGKTQKELPEMVEFVRAMADDFREQYPSVKIYMTGIAMLNNAYMEISKDDMAHLMPIMFLVLMLVMGLLLRSFSGTFSTVMIIGASAATAMGLAGWLGIRITPPSSSAPTIILTLAVADSIHILVTLFHEMRRGQSKRQAIVESLRVNLQPIFLTTVTTAIGFLTLNFSDTPPFNDLGNMVAIGVIAAFYYSVFFLPALMAVLPVRVRAGVNGQYAFMDRLGDFVVAQRQRLFWGMASVILILAAMIPLNTIGEQWVEYFDDRYTFRTDTDFISDNLSGIYTVQYSLGSGETGGISRPEYQAKLEEFAGWYRQQPEVVQVSTYSDIMKRLNKNMHADEPAYYRIPEERTLAAQYLLLYEMSLPYGLDLNNQINIEKSKTRFTAQLRDLSTPEILSLEKRADDWVEGNLPEEMRAPGSSPAVMFSHIMERNIISMIGGTTLALILISGILVIALRDLRTGLISLVPNLVPAGMAFGLWGLLVSEINVGTSIVAAMSLGIVVDDTVHFLSKYRRARTEHGLDAAGAVRYSFRTVGTALLVTSLVLFAGFSVFNFSGFGMNYQMGVLTAIALVIALVVDFLFLPTLLMRFDRKRAAVPAVETVRVQNTKVENTFEAAS
ncbi:MAG TPA: MMPL family transporter [Nitrospiria bacterium]